MDFAVSGQVLRFDDEGNPTADASRQIYGVKLFVQYAELTGAESRQARRVAVVVCSKSSSAWKKFESLATAADLDQEKWPREVHVRSVIMAKMDGAAGS